MTLAYIAGPLSIGDQALNVRRAIDAAETLLSSGVIPFVPHLTHFWHLIYDHNWETWLKIDEEILTRCDCILRIPGESSGADRECNLAYHKNIPVFIDIDSLVSYFKND
jgi:hypothetical protein